MNLIKAIRKLSLLLLASITIFTFIACDGEVNMELYTSDLLDCFESDEVLMSKVSLVIEGMSEEYSYDFLRDYIPSFSNPHYIDYDYSTSLAFDIQVPIIKKKDLEAFDDTGYLFEIVGVKTTSGYSYYLNINSPLMNSINSYTSSTMYQSFKLEDFDFNYRLFNDLRESHDYKAFSCYNNGKAYPNTYSFTLDRRGYLDFKFSEVFSKSLNSEEKNYFITVCKDK